MKILVVGCGSIGCRHARHAAEAGDAAVVDTEDSRATEAARVSGARSFGADLASALNWGPDGVVVAVPAAHHLVVAERAIEAGADLLIEKPISQDLQATDALLRCAERKSCRVFVVCNMRFHPAVQALREHIAAIGEPLFARAHYGNYLPGMRPNVDYRNLYAADSEEGGIVLDGIHEIDYLKWLLGPIQSLVADADHLSDLEIEAEDYSAIIMHHVGGIRSELHLDYLRRVKRRGCEIVGTDGVLDWISEGKEPERCAVRLYTCNFGWRTLLELSPVNADRPFAALMRAFVSAIQGADTELQTGTEARSALAAALVARKGRCRKEILIDA